MSIPDMQESAITPEQAIQQAISLHKEGRLQEAEQIYCSILESDPNHSVANHNLGTLAVQSEQLAAGVQFFKTALEADPLVAQHWLSYIDALIKTGKYDLARQLLTEGRARGLAGESADTLDEQLANPALDEINELVALFNEKRYSEAENSARRLTERLPEHGFGWKVLGVALMAQGLANGALEPFRKAVELLPMDAESHKNLGNTLQLTGQLFKAEASCRRALELKPDYAEAFFVLGNTLKNLRRESEAEECYARALQIEPDFNEADGILNTLRKEQGHLLVKKSSADKTGIESDAKGTLAVNPIEFFRNNKEKGIGKMISLVGGLIFFAGMFVMWGNVGSGKSGSLTSAAMVDGKEISMATFNNSYSKNLELSKARFGAAFTPELERKLAIRKATLDALINSELLYGSSERQGLKVSNEEVIQAVEAQPVFRKNGEFDLELYRQVLARNNQTPKQFENGQKKELLARKAHLALTAPVQVTDQEMKNLYHKERDQLVLSYFAVTPENVRKDIKVTEAEIADYYEKSRKLFMLPEKIAISYIRLGQVPEKTPVSFSQQEIEGFYNSNFKRYQVKGENPPPLQQVKSRVIKDLIKEKSMKGLLEKAADARYKNSGKTGLKPVSDTLGIPLKKSRMFAAEAPPQEFIGEKDFINKLFSLKNGEIGGPFEATNAVYLVQVSGREPSSPALLSTVRAKIEERLRSEKSAIHARKKAEEALLKLSQGFPVPQLRETDAFNYNLNGRIPGIGELPELMEEAFLFAPGVEVAKKIYGANNQWYAVRLKERKPSSEADFERVKPDLMKRIMGIKQQQVVETWLATERARAKIEINAQLAAAIAKESTTP